MAFGDSLTLYYVLDPAQNIIDSSLIVAYSYNKVNMRLVVKCVRWNVVSVPIMFSPAHIEI